jgi:uncharacterized Zn-binding protein involved in type VI secretion
MSPEQPFYRTGPQTHTNNPGEHLWSIRKDGQQLDCELRDHGSWGVSGVRWNVIALSLALLAGACSPTTPSSSSTCISKGSLSAQIDGVPWAATCVVIAHSDPSGYCSD